MYLILPQCLIACQEVHHLVEQAGLLAHTVVAAISSHLLMVGQMPSPFLLFSKPH